MLSVRLAQLRFKRNLLSRKCFQKRNDVRLCSTGPIFERHYGKKDREAFDQTYPEVKKCLIDIIKKYDNTILPDWMEKCAAYNLANGPVSRGQIVVLAFKRLASDSDLNVQNLKMAQYVGWCVEIQEIATIFSDDQIDKADTRRGKPAWHRVDGDGDQAANDSHMLNLATFICLENLIGHKDYYCKIAGRLRDGAFSTFVGQSLDFLNAKSCITNFTMEKYMNIIKQKVGEYAYYLPVALALDMCGSNNPAIYEEAFKILGEISFHGQIRDDYNDCFGRRDQTGTDIQENKLTWVAVNAVRLADESQLAILKSCYGQNDPDKVEKVRSVYKDLRLDELLKDYETKYYDEMTQMINNSLHDNMKPVYKHLFEQLNKYDTIG